MENIPQETIQFVHGWQPDNKRGYRQEDEAERKNSAARADIGRRYILLTTSEPPLEKYQTKKTKNMNPWEQIGVLKFSPKGQGVGN